MRLKDKVAIITGAGTGIGEAISHKFSREGARVLLAGLPSDPVKDVADTIVAGGGEAGVFLGDLSDEATARGCVDAAVKRFGKLDVLVNNAGIFIANAETQQYRIEDFDRTIRCNIRTAFLMTKFALPHLQKTRGCVLFTGSGAGNSGSGMMTPYGGSKGFLHAFARGVAVEQAHYGVRANCVCPGPIDTAWTRGPGGPLSIEIQATIDQTVPLGRRGSPEEIANVFAFLASDEASYVTGALVDVDGGSTPAMGMAGMNVPDELRRPPESTLPLRHSHDGLRGKEVYVAK
jgi:NAD(P)-dependent dehydrogenase (short-subunit alcohol dehydrogenase family)